MKHLFLLAVAIALTAVAAVAQPPTPEALAAQQLEAGRAGDWAGYAAKMHPKSLQRLKDMLTPLINFAQSDGRKEAGEMSAALFGGRDLAEVKALEPAAFFELFMSSLAKLPGMGDALKNIRGEVLGHIKEGDNVVHVVTRTSTSIPGAIDYKKLEVISFERDGAEWKGLLSGDMELQIGQMLQRLRAGSAENGEQNAEKKPAKKGSRK